MNEDQFIQDIITFVKNHEYLKEQNTKVEVIENEKTMITEVDYSLHIHTSDGDSESISISINLIA